MKQIVHYIFVISFLVSSTSLWAQNSTETIEQTFAELSNRVPGLNQKVDVMVGKSTIQAFLSGLGESHALNISVDPSLNIPIYANFSNETVANVLLYLIKQYDLEVTFTGTIISFKKKPLPPEPEAEPNIIFHSEENTITLDLKNDDLDQVVRKIIDLSGINITIDPSLQGKKVQGLIKELPLHVAIDKLALANSFEWNFMEDSTFYLKRITNSGMSSGNIKQIGNGKTTQGIQIAIDEDIQGQTIVSISAINKPIVDIIKTLFQQIEPGYIFFAEPAGNITLSIQHLLLDDVLSFLLNATDYTYKKQEDIYLFGLRDNEKLRNTTVLQLSYRSVNEISSVIPAEIKDGVEIDEFPELNSLILSGSQPNINEITTFIQAVDQPVPVVMIELIIVDILKTNQVSSGLEMGLASEPKETGGTFLPGLDVTISASSINSFLNNVGLTNLGRVAPNFYVQLSLMETNGIVDIQSTPRLSTLNSHEATLSIGETSYYLEQQQNVIGTQNPQTVITNQFKSVNADFAITIKPIVSGDEHVTLDVDVSQSTFTGTVVPGGPPNQANRDFQSSIRVKNEEMIVLGGLEKTEKNDSGSGLPVVSRIPVLKWFFGKRQKKKERSKLMIFIKPTIIY